jgi:hypothetical protein
MPDELLNSKLTVARAPLDSVTGQVTLVPGLTGTLDGQFTCAALTPAPSRACWSCWSSWQRRRARLASSLARCCPAA